MSGIIGKKVGMTSIFDANGKNIPCTVIEAGPCIITRVKTQRDRWLQCLQIGFENQKEKQSKPKWDISKKQAQHPKKS